MSEKNTQDSSEDKVLSTEGNKPVDPKDLIIINGSQDFQAGVAYVAVSYRELSGVENTSDSSNQAPKPIELRESVYLVSSKKLKIPFNSFALNKHQIVVERNPYPPTMRWEVVDLEKYLRENRNISLKEIHSAIVDYLKKHVEFNDLAWHDVVALWIIGTYFHRMFPSYPYVHLNGNAGTGKTKCMTLIASLAFNGELSVNSTPSYLTRLVHDTHATVCIDEVEKLQKARDEESKTVLAMLNAGYKRGSFIGKSEQKRQGGTWYLKRFEAYSPKVLAGIQGLAATLASRCIPITMLRSANKEIVNLEVDESSKDIVAMRNNLYRCMLTNHEKIQAKYKEISDSEILGRPWELWRALLAIAQLVDEETYKKVRILALYIEQVKKEIEGDNILAPKILLVLYEMMTGHGDEEMFYPTFAVYDRLYDYDNDVFGWLKDEKNKNSRGKWLTKQLRLAGAITGNTEQKRVQGVPTKGYTLNKETLLRLLKSHNIVPTESIDAQDKYLTPEQIGINLPF